MITDGTTPLQIDFTATTKLGMTQTDKVAGLLVLLNVHLQHVQRTVQNTTTYFPACGAMVCIQWTPDGTHWLTIKRTERFQWARTLQVEAGFSSDSSQRGAMTADDQQDVYVNQDIGLRTLILPADLPSPTQDIKGIRAAAAVWDAGVAPPTGSAVVLKEGNLSVIPIHAKVS